MASSLCSGIVSEAAMPASASPRVPGSLISGHECLCVVRPPRHRHRPRSSGQRSVTSGGILDRPGQHFRGASDPGGLSAWPARASPSGGTCERFHPEQVRVCADGDCFCSQRFPSPSQRRQRPG